MVCAKEGLPQPVGPDEAARFFAAFYPVLLSGGDVQSALSAGCAAEPSLQDVYCWYNSQVCVRGGGMCALLCAYKERMLYKHFVGHADNHSDTVMQ